LADERETSRKQRQNQFGLSQKDEDTARERTRTFNKIILQNLKSQLKIVSQSYQVRKELGWIESFDHSINYPLFPLGHGENILAAVGQQSGPKFAVFKLSTGLQPALQAQGCPPRGAADVPTSAGEHVNGVIPCVKIIFVPADSTVVTPS
jgi:hypothetical protein